MEIISRVDATSVGLTHYFTGVPCKHGHVATRFVSTRVCTDCHKATYQRRLLDSTFVETERARQRSEKYKAGVQSPENCAKRKPKLSAYRKKNRDKINAHRRATYRENETFRLSVIMRSHLQRVLKITGEVKTSSMVSMFGYTPKMLRDHLQSLFKPGMSWENYGEWHIDHKIPITLLTLYGITDPAFINSLSNLQPMWAIENMSKGNRSVCQ